MSFYAIYRNILSLALSAVLLATAGQAWAQHQVQKIDGVSFVSGGVGDESMAQLAAIESEFNLKLFLVGKSGTYLSDIGITITDANDKGVLVTTSEGPVLLAKLPTGTYLIKGNKNGDVVTLIANVLPGQMRSFYLRFPNE